MRPNPLTTEAAAMRIQAGFRGMRARLDVAARRAAVDAARVAAEDAATRDKAATCIQALFRGHSLRVALALGRGLGLTLGKGI